MAGAYQIGTPIWDFTLMVGSYPFYQLLDHGDVNDNGKHSSVLQYGNNYVRNILLYSGQYYKTFLSVIYKFL
jgi:hypothetical protein